MNREATARTLQTLRSQAHDHYDHSQWTHWCATPACLAAWVCIANACTIEPLATDGTLWEFTRVPGNDALVHVRNAARTILDVSEETALYLFDNAEVLCDETGDIFQPDATDAIALLERALASGQWRWVHVPHHARTRTASVHAATTPRVNHRGTQCNAN